MVSLSKQHMINSLLDKYYSKKVLPHCIAMFHLMPKQYLKIKSLIMDTNNHLNKVSPSFDSLNKELSLGFYLVDTFSDCFSFISVNQKDSDVLTVHCNRLNNIFEDSIVNQDTMLIILDSSVKNNIVL